MYLEKMFMGNFDMFKKKPAERTPKERRAASIERLKKHGIAYTENLPVICSASEVKLRSVDEICKRAIASLLTVQLAFDLEADVNVLESIEFITQLLEQYGVMQDLNELEKKMVYGGHCVQDILDVIWEYECYWSLVWALGLIDDISEDFDTCDCRRAIDLVKPCENFAQFKSKCKLRSVEEILDMLDLYYCYHWACVDKRINPQTATGQLDEEIVMERRRGLEWLVGEENDWHSISLDT